MRFVRFLVAIAFIATSAFTLYVKFSDKTDYNAPVIICDNKDLKLSVSDDVSSLLKYVKATDEKDGDLSKNIIVESISPFINENNAKVVFTVCDSDNNVTKLEKNISYTDYRDPEFSMERCLVFYEGATRADLLSGIKALDVLDGDITTRIVVESSDLDLSTAGVYPITYKVLSSKGKVSRVTVNAYVYEARLQNTIELKEYLVYTDVNQKLSLKSYLDSYPKNLLEDGYSRDYTYELKVQNDIDYTKPGTYTVSYKIIRKNKNAYTEESRQESVIAETYLTVCVRGNSK